MSLEILKKIEPVQDVNEYWRVHKIFKREINKQSRKVFKFIKNPEEFIKDFENLLNEGVRLNIITEEYKKEKMKKLYDELNSPTRFKEDVKRRLLKAKNKFKLKKNKIKN